MVMVEILKEEINIAETEMKKLEENKSSSAIIRKFQSLKYSRWCQRKKMLEQRLFMEDIRNNPKDAYSVDPSEYFENTSQIVDGIYCTPNVEKICYTKNKEYNKEGIKSLVNMKCVCVSTTQKNDQEVLVVRATKYGRLCLIFEGKKEETKGFER